MVVCEFGVKKIEQSLADQLKTFLVGKKKKKKNYYAAWDLRYLIYTEKKMYIDISEKSVGNLYQSYFF